MKDTLYNNWSDNTLTIPNTSILNIMFLKIDMVYILTRKMENNNTD